MLRQPGLYLDFKSVLKLKLKHKKKKKSRLNLKALRVTH